MQPPQPRVEGVDVIAIKRCLMPGARFAAMNHLCSSAIRLRPLRRHAVDFDTALVYRHFHLDSPGRLSVRPRDPATRSRVLGISR